MHWTFQCDHLDRTCLGTSDEVHVGFSPTWIDFPGVGGFSVTQLVESATKLLPKLALLTSCIVVSSGVGRESFPSSCGGPLRLVFAFSSLPKVGLVTPLHGTLH
eukprot:900098-Amphidinium_carterae.1